MDDDDINKVGAIARKIEKMIKRDSIDCDKMLLYMDYLDSSSMTLDILTKTGIGLIVNQLRHKTQMDIDKRAKRLIRKWRTLVPAASEQTNGASPPYTGSKRKLDTSDCVSLDSFTSAENEAIVTKKPSIEPVENGNSHSKSHTVLANHLSESRLQFLHQQNATDDIVRIKGRELLQKALESSDVPSGSYDTEYLAIQIETAMFKLFLSSGDTKYKNKLRSLVSNLKDKGNPQLRLNVLMGHVSAERLPLMTPQEMASEEIKKMRDEITKEAINEHQLAVQGGTETDLIKCRKCGKNKCTYTQLQTRSSDEPMTTFVFCSSCGHRFKFN